MIFSVVFAKRSMVIVAVAFLTLIWVVFSGVRLEVGVGYARN